VVISTPADAQQFSLFFPKTIMPPVFSSLAAFFYELDYF
jgi:hypothetical protein